MAARHAGRRALLSSRERALLIEDVPDAVVVLDHDGRLLHANPAFERILGYPPRDVAGRLLTELVVSGLSRPGCADLDAWLASRTLLVGALHHNGTEVPVEIGFGRPQNQGGHWRVVAVLRDGTPRIESGAARRRADLLSQAGAILVASRGLAALKALAERIVSEYAGACTLDVVTPSGSLHRVAEARAPGIDASDPVGLRTGVEETLRSGEPRRLELASDEEARSAVIAPLCCAGKTIGALACVTAPKAPTYGDDDLAFAQGLAHQVALALDQARILSCALSRIGHGLVVLAQSRPRYARAAVASV